jgi:hypothetical protein
MTIKRQTRVLIFRLGMKLRVSRSAILVVTSGQQQQLTEQTQLGFQRLSVVKLKFESSLCVRVCVFLEILQPPSTRSLRETTREAQPCHHEWYRK